MVEENNNMPHSRAFGLGRLWCTSLATVPASCHAVSLGMPGVKDPFEGCLPYRASFLCSRDSVRVCVCVCVPSNANRDFLFRASDVVSSGLCG